MAGSVVARAWEPIVGPEHGALAERLAQARSEIIDALRGLTLEGATDPGLANGRAGMALSLDYLGLGELGRPWMDAALDDVSTVDLSEAFCDGFSGIAWLLEHVLRRIGDEEDGNEETDEALLEILGQGGRWDGYLDLMHGVVGLGVYAIERTPRPNGRRLLEAIVARLAERAVARPDGISWKTPPGLLPPHQREVCPDGYINLGVSHGIGGILPILAFAMRQGIAAAEPLFVGGVRYLRSVAMPGPSFPSWVVEGRESHPARTAWCYGDLGLAATLHLSARTLDDTALAAFAIELGDHAARRTLETSQCADGALCHGAAGNAHVLNRLFQATGREPYADAARRWLEDSFRFRDAKNRYAGYYAWEPAGRMDDPTFLTGAAGVALAYHAATTNEAPSWDRALLLSFPG